MSPSQAKTILLNAVASTTYNHKTTPTKTPRTTLTRMKAENSTQAEASRINGQKSLGPITQEGKANSAKNSFKHGLYSKQVVLDEESAAALETLRQDLRAEHQPINNTEAILVDELALNFWSIKRYRQMEADTLNGNPSIIRFESVMPVVLRFLTSSQRAFERVLKQLQSLQKQRGFVPQNAETASNGQSAPTAQTITGFVPQEIETEQIPPANLQTTVIEWAKNNQIDLLNCTADQVETIAAELASLTRAA